MIERLFPPLRPHPALRRSIEWFALAYVVIMPVAMAILNGVRCLGAGCQRADVAGLLMMGIRDAFDTRNLTWHLVHAAMIAASAGVFGHYLNKVHKREQALLQERVDKYHEAIEKLESGFYRTTLDGHFLLANTRFVTMLGYESLEELMRAPVSTLYPASSGRDRFLAELREKGHVHQKEFLLVKKDGTPLIVTDDAHLVGDTITGIISVVERAVGKDIVPVCAYCNRMRNGNADDATWVRPETYLRDHMKEIKDPLHDIEFSHGICPLCVQREFPGVLPKLPKAS